MKKLITLLLGLALVFGLTACGGNSGSKSGSSAAPELTVIKVGATPAPHAEILEQCVEDMKALGYDLQVVVFEDYVIPNTSVESGELDANYFQHTPYLENFNAERGTHLVSAVKVHYEPFAIYPGVRATLDDANGAEIAVPNDTTNEARALLLLQDLGLITLPENAGLTVTALDIVENKANVKITELEAAQLPRALKDVDFAVINGNYALEAGLTGNDALAYESAEGLAADTFGNVLAVKSGNENNEAIQALVKVLTSDKIRDFIKSKYDGAVVPLF